MGYIFNIFLQTLHLLRGKMITKRGKGKGKGYDSDYLAAYYIYDKREAWVFLIQRHTSAPKLAGERENPPCQLINAYPPRCIRRKKSYLKTNWRVSYTLSPFSFSSLLGPSVPWSIIGRNKKREEEKEPLRTE